MSVTDDWGGLELDPTEVFPWTDEMLEQAAAGTRSVAPPFAAPRLSPRQAEQLDTSDQWEPVVGAPRSVGRIPARTVVHEHALLEAAVFKSDLHPRWPKGSGKKAGQFMEVGQTFTSGGKTWQIAHIVKGRIYAHEASADYHAVGTKSFDVTKEAGTGHVTVPDAEYKAPSKVPKGGKESGSTVTIIDPYVDSSTHDPSIQLPEGSQISPEEWQRFGRVDQDHYVELMERFGKHKPGAAKTHVDASYAKFQGAVQNLVKKAYQTQYGTSSGFTLSLSAGHGAGAIPDTPEMAQLREQALALQAEHAAAVQWDLYNRTRSPDMLSVHKSRSWSAEKWQSYAVEGSDTAFSGMSQSFAYRRNFFGKPGVVTPLAIRHVLMSSKSAQPVPGENHFPGELEVSVAQQMKLDHRTIVVTSQSGSKHSLSATQMSWLEGVTNEPAPGAVVEQLQDALKNGTYLPPPPKQASITMDGAGGKTWVDPPLEAAKPDFGAEQLPAVGDTVDPATLPKDLPWNHTEDDGTPKAVTGDEAGAQAGQYFMGLKGTLYWIGKDPGQGGGYPFRIHKIVDGAFNGENFAYNPDLPGYYMDAHHAEPELKPDELPPFNAAEWVNSTDAKFLEQFEPGEKFKLNGTPYEVTGPSLHGGSVKIKDLESGLTGVINGDYKSTFLVAHDGSTGAHDEVGKPVFAVGQHVVVQGDYVAVVDAVDDAGGLHVTGLHSGAGQVEVGPEDLVHVQTTAPVVGVTFPYRKPGDPFDAPKVKATVTKVLANGDVQANLKPGKVVIPSDEWAGYAQHAYDPNGHVIGAKAKLRDLKPGEMFHGSAGNQTHRPYMVLMQYKPAQGGAKTVVRNMDTGEVSELGAHKSYPTLDAFAHESPALPADKITPDSPTGPGNVGPEWDPAKYELGPHQNLYTLPAGTFFQGAAPGMVFHIDGHRPDENGDDAVWVSKVYPDVEEAIPFSNADGLETTVVPYQLKDATQANPDGSGAMVPDAPATGFDPGAYVEGSKTKIKNLPAGSVFKTDSKSGPKYYQLSDDGAHITNLQTGKVYAAKGHFSATPLSKGGAHGDGKGSLPETYPVDGIAVFHNPQTFNVAAAQIVGHTPQGVTVKMHGAETTVDPATISHVEDGGNFAEAQLASDEIAHSELTDLLSGQAQNQTHVLPNGTKVHRVPNGWRVENANGDLDKVHAAATDAADRALHLDAAAGAVPKLKPVPNANHVYSAGEELTDGDGNPVLKGGAYFVGNTKVKPLGSANTPGLVKVETASGEHQEVLPEALTVAPLGNQHTVSPLGTNAKGLTFGAMPDGAEFSPAHNGIHYVKTDAATAVNQNTGEPHHFDGDYVPDDLHHMSLSDAYIGKLVTAKPDADAPPSLQATSPVTGYVKKVRASDGAVQLYGGALWHQPHNVTVHDEMLPPLENGTPVQLEDGTKGTFVGYDEMPNGDPGAQINVGNMELITVSPEWMTELADPGGIPDDATPLSPKSHNQTPYEQLSQGDAVQLGNLKPGDTFAMPDDPLGAAAYKVAEQTPGQDYETVHVVAPSGAVFDSGLAPSHVVKLDAKAADQVDAVAPGSKYDPASLMITSHAVTDGGLVPYGEPQGGPFAFTPVGVLPQHAVFEDAGGGVWKVKRTGPTPVISGGSQVYALEGHHLVKDLSQPAAPTPQFVDEVPDEGLHPQVMQADEELVPNLTEATLGSLHVNEGDFYSPSSGEGIGDPHVVTGKLDSLILSMNLATGATAWHGSNHVPYTVSPQMVVDVPEPPVPDVPEPPASLYSQPADAGDLAPGTSFTLAPGSSKVFQVQAKHAQTVDYAEQGAGGFTSSGQLGLGSPVWVQAPGAMEPEPEPSFPVPEAPTADPGTLPPVEGPNGFAPVSPVPVLDPNFSLESTLDPFTSRKGPGGIYSYPRLHETQPGQMFTDKSGTDYRVVEHGSATTVYEHVASGAQHAAPSDQRVKLTALPPDPGPQLKNVVNDLVHKYGSLESVPKLDLNGHQSAVQSDGKTKNPRLGHLAYGDIAYDADGHQVVFLGSWLNRALVLDGATNDARLADAGTRVTVAG